MSVSYEFVLKEVHCFCSVYKTEAQGNSGLEIYKNTTGFKYCGVMVRVSQ